MVFVCLWQGSIVVVFLLFMRILGLLPRRSAIVPRSPHGLSFFEEHLPAIRISVQVALRAERRAGIGAEGLAETRPCGTGGSHWAARGRRAAIGRSPSLFVPGLVALDVPSSDSPHLLHSPYPGPTDPISPSETLPRLIVPIPPTIPSPAHCPYLGPQFLSWPTIPPPAHNLFPSPQSIFWPHSANSNPTVTNPALQLVSLPHSDFSCSPVVAIPTLQWFQLQPHKVYFVSSIIGSSHCCQVKLLLLLVEGSSVLLQVCEVSTSSLESIFQTQLEKLYSSSSPTVAIPVPQ